MQTLYEKICTCAVFYRVTEQPLFRAFERYCHAENSAEKRKAYSAFVREIYENGGSLTELVSRLVFEDENAYIKAVAKGREADVKVRDSAKRELAIFSAFASLTRADFALDMGLEAMELSDFRSVNAYLYPTYEERLKNVGKYGYGIFSASGMFRLSDEKEICPIVSADETQTDDFVGYEEEREKVFANTRAFVAGKPAANALLCGDAGTGKSSTVKAAANAFFSEGVRLIEIRKDQLSHLPLVMAKISGNPLKFILFIDDLSFGKNDDSFSMLKAVLEGSASVTAKNAVIYATSNRRHIVKESFSDRDGDDVHINDTLQETLSLSERFGLVVHFSKPSKALYLEIVQKLAQKRGVQMEEEELYRRAEEFALRKGSRSARCAKQFIDSLL